MRTLHRDLSSSPSRWSSSAIAVAAAWRGSRATWPTRRQRLATLQYDAAQESLAEAGAVRGPRAVGAVARQRRSCRRFAPAQAALQYWQKAVRRVLPAQAEPVAAVDDDNVELQLVVANAAFRTGSGPLKDKTATMKALERPRPAT